MPTPSADPGPGVAGDADLGERIAVRSPASVASRPRAAWIAHAGCAIALPGGAPTRATLGQALALEADWIELDLCATCDGAIVLRHDVTLPSGRPLATITLAELRRREPDTLTFDEAVEAITGRVPLLLDLKTPLVIPELCRRLRSVPEGSFAVCTESVPWLVEMRAGAPAVPRWLSLPEMGTGSYQSVRRVLSGLLEHRHRGGLATLGRELGSVVREARSRPGDGLGRLGGVPWRAHLPFQIEHLARQVGASALSLHHWVVTPEVCEAAHAEGLPVAAWTVNRGDTARRLADCGVDFITTDDVAAMRRAT